MECIIRIDRLPLVNATFNNISVNSFAISYKVLFFLNNHLPTAFDEQTFKAPRYIVYHLTEKSNKESVLDKPNIRETKRKEVSKGEC
jgi:hypothetical protein